MSIMDSGHETPQQTGTHRYTENKASTTRISDSVASIPMMHRVKVYKCGDEGQWLDQGTGYVECNQSSDSFELLVHQEDPDAPPPEPGSSPILTDNIILKTVLVADDVYHRQQETLIVWTEPNGANYALSFQEAAGCNIVWEQLLMAQREMAIFQPDDKLEDNMSADEYAAGRSLDIPDPALANLVEIENMLNVWSRSAWGRDQLVHYILSHEFLPKLLPIFQICEDLENIDDLYTLSAIVKAVLLLNDATIYDYIFREDVFVQIIGILEYDREYSKVKGNYRDHILNVAKFKQVVPITHRDIVSKINLTYRIQFLKDVVIARLMDDGIFSTLSSLIYFNQLEILTFISQDHAYLASVFDILQSDSATMDQKNEVVLFLNELCGVAKSLPVANRSHFYRQVDDAESIDVRALGQHGLFAIFEHTVDHPEVTIRLAAVAILNHLLEHDPTMVRSYCLAQMRQNQPILLGFLITRCIKEDDEGLRSQIAESIKVLLDTSKSDLAQNFGGASGASIAGDSEMDDFLNMFYEKHVALLMDPILSLEASDETVILTTERANLCNQLCELISFAVKNHTYRSKYYVLGSKIIEKMCVLLNAKQSFVRLSALRFFRICVGLKDEFYNRHLTKCDVFGPILSMLHSTQGQYNLLNSATLELFEFIRKENQKTLIDNLVEKYRKSMESITYINTFQNLILKYEQAHEVDTHPTAEPTQVSGATGTKDGWAKIDKSEEDYFNTSDEEEVNGKLLSPSKQDTPSTIHVQAKTSPAKTALVDYPDDDEDASDPLLSPIQSTSPPPLFKKKQDDDDDEFPLKKRKLIDSKIGFGFVSTKSSSGGAKGFIKLQGIHPASPQKTLEKVEESAKKSPSGALKKQKIL